MAIFYGGKQVAPSFNNLQQTDFSKATAHPEFVGEGKTFFDETGQLRVGKRKFTDANVELEEVEVAADFSAGDQVVNASTGKAMTKATIKKPAELLPENIKNGVIVGGIVGTYETESEGLIVTQNGDYKPPAGKQFSSVSVNVSQYKFLEKAHGTLTEIAAADLEGVETLAAYAFAYCKELQSVALPDSVAAIGEYAFTNCSALQSITLPNSISSIGTRAFEQCSALQSITLPSGLTEIANNLFYFSGLQSITIPSSVTSIGNRAFYYCRSLQSIELPSGLTALGDSAFEQCSALQSIELPSGVTEIKEETFKNCAALSSIVCEGDLSAIGKDAFYYCSACLVYDFTACTSVPTLANLGFTGINSAAQIKVPSALYDEWIAATNWSYSTIASKIVAV